MKNICISLLKAKSEEEVSQVIRENPDFFAQTNWHPFPDGSYGTIESQGRDPHRALVEKITNAIDAILLRECAKLRINPESQAEAPSSIIEAVEKFFGISAGDIAGLPKSKIDRLASEIYLIGENIKDKRGNIYIVDKGEGQDPKNFKDTFLKFGGNKVKTLFVHGRFGTGSFGVLPNAGEKGYELIISKKYNPDSSNGEWGWTLIRKNSGEDIYTRRAWYEYVLPEGEIPTFSDSDLVNVLHDAIGYEKLDIQDYKHGTIVKVYDYDLVTTSDLDRDLSRILDRYLFSPALPYRILNAQTKSHVAAGKEQSGNLNRLRKNKEELEGGEKITIQKAKLGVLGNVDIDIYIGKKNPDKRTSIIDTEKMSTRNESVFFIRNGQSHGEIDRSFLKNDVGLSYIANDMVVYIDCTNAIPTQFDKAFPPTRDIMRNNRSQEDVRSDLENELKNHEGLKQLNMQRKNTIITEEVKKSEDLESFIGDLMQYDPTLRMLLTGSMQVDYRSERGQTENKFEGKKFPTYLKVKDREINQNGYKNVPINSYVNVVLETDAENNYLTREEDAGSIVTNSNCEVGSIKLYNGRLTLRFFPSKSSVVDKEEEVNIELTRPFEDSLTVAFKIKITKEIEKGNNPPPPPPPPHGNQFNLPPLYPLSKEDWASAGYEETDLAELEKEKNDEKSVYVLKGVSVNTGFPFLDLYFKNQRFTSKQIEIMKNQFVHAVYLAALSIHRNFAKEHSYPDEKVKEIINNVGFCLPYSLFTMQKKILRELEN